MATLNRVLDLLCKALLWVAVVAGMLMTGFVVLASLMRYLVGSPFRFTEELVGLLFVAMACLGLPWATLHDRHLRITLIPERLPPPLRKLSELMSTLAILAFSVYFGILAWDFAYTSLRINARSEMGGIPLFPWMALLPLMAALVGVAVIALHHRQRRGLRPAPPPQV